LEGQRLQVDFLAHDHQDKWQFGFTVGSQPSSFRSHFFVKLVYWGMQYASMCES